MATYPPFNNARVHNVYPTQDDNAPSGGSPDLDALAQTLTEASGIVEHLREQAQQGRRHGYLDGYSAGYERAQAETVRQALEAHTSSREFVDGAQQHIISMALASLEMVASRLGSATVVTAMLTDVLEGIKAERQLKVSVSRGAVKATREMLAEWLFHHPGTDVQVLVDPKLEPFGCEIESELGRITLGFRKHVDAIREQLDTVVSVSMVKDPTGTFRAVEDS